MQIGVEAGNVIRCGEEGEVQYNLLHSDGWRDPSSPTSTSTLNIEKLRKFPSPVDGTSIPYCGFLILIIIVFLCFWSLLVFSVESIIA